MILADLRVLFGHCGICFFWNIWLAMTNSSHYYKRSYSYDVYTFTTLQIRERLRALLLLQGLLPQCCLLAFSIEGDI